LGREVNKSQKLFFGKVLIMSVLAKWWMSRSIDKSIGDSPAGKPEWKLIVRAIIKAVNIFSIVYG
jgi:hypothetical protein